MVMLGRRPGGKLPTTWRLAPIAGLTGLIAAGCAARIVQITAGGEHACARTDRGRVLCWGRNDRGALGDGSTQDRAVPVEVAGLRDAVEVAAGGEHSCARRATGAVVCWGGGEGEPEGGGSPPRLVPVEIAGAVGATQLALGARHACALRPGGVVCWGSNSAGQLGDGTRDPRSGVVAVARLDPVIAIASGAGADHSCGLRRDGSANCWGSNRGGELGDPAAAGWSPSARVVGPEGNTIEGITAIGVGGEHTCARRRDGAVLCWGSSDRGQRGDGTFTAASPTPAPVLDLHDAADVAAGRQHSCARRASGVVVCWGTGTMGQIGDGAKVDRNAPVAVRGVTGAVALALGYDFSCALLGDGAVTCWGANGFGQLGDGSVAPSGDTDDLGEYDKAGPPRGPVRVRVEP